MSSSAAHEVTSMTRSWPALDAAPLRLVSTVRVAFSGPSLWVPGAIAMWHTLDANDYKEKST